MPSITGSKKEPELKRKYHSLHTLNLWSKREAPSSKMENNVQRGQLVQSVVIKTAMQWSRPRMRGQVRRLTPSRLFKPSQTLQVLARALRLHPLSRPHQGRQPALCKEEQLDVLLQIDVEHPMMKKQATLLSTTWRLPYARKSKRCWSPII